VRARRVLQSSRPCEFARDPKDSQGGKMLRQCVLAACFVLPLAVIAADKTTQQQKMTDCNKEASAKKLAGDERKAFMSQCLSVEGADKQTDQQQKMTTCNKEASDKNLAGDARKAFMSQCLSGSAAPANMTQQEKMGYCNKQAGAKKLEGDARKKFMSECLSG
jgi:uncharacterized protein HemX